MRCEIFRLAISQGQITYEKKELWYCICFRNVSKSNAYIFDFM